MWFEEDALVIRKWRPRRPVFFAGLIIPLITLAVALSPGLSGWCAPPAAATTLTIERISWSIVGLDSNNVNVGPDTFPVAVRVCNTGAAATDPLTSTFSPAAVNAYISLVSPSATQAYPALVPGTCQDVYYWVKVTRDAAAYTTTGNATVTVTDGTNTVSVTQELEVEHLISQNRNSTISVSGPSVVQVGQQYTWTVNAKTATQGYEQLETFLTMCPSMFRIDSVTMRLSAPAPTTWDKLWTDGCSWDHTDNWHDPTNSGCLDTSGIKYGGDLVYDITATVLSGGSCSLQDLIYDFSGSSFHYNSDYGSFPAFTITASSPACVNGTVFKDDSNPAGDIYNGTPPDTAVSSITLNLYQDTNDNGVYDPGTDLLAATGQTLADGTYELCAPADVKAFFIGVDSSSSLVSGYTLDNPTSSPTAVPGAGFSGTQTVDFDFDPPAGITGFLYIDDGAGGGAAANEVKDGAEVGISSRSVTYYLDDGDGVYEPGGDDGAGKITAPTGASGQYTISGLAAGTYWVAAPTSVGANLLETAITANPRQVTVTAGTVTSNGTDFGYLASGGITGYLYRDENTSNTMDGGETAVNGQTLTLYQDDGDGVYEPGAGDTLVTTALTDSAGQYAFAGLDAGNYWVTGPISVDGGNYDVGTTNPVLVAVTSGTVNANAANNIGYDPDPTAVGTLTGTTYKDGNLNDIYDAGSDNTLNGVLVTVYKDDGDGVYEPGTDDALVTTATSSGGTYTVNNLVAGDYWVLGEPTSGGSLIGTPNPVPVTIPAGGTDTADFGYDTNSTDINVVAYLDNGAGGGTASNSTKDGGELGVADIPISLYLDDGDGDCNVDAGDTFLASMVSGGTGQVLFSGLSNSNDYCVLLGALPAGYSLLVGELSYRLISSPSPGNTIDWDFPLLFSGGTGDIAGTAFQDDGGTSGAIGDNTKNGDEAGIGGLTATLYNDVNGNGVYDAGTDTLAATTTTTSTGAFLFDSLPAGKYLVQLPATSGSYTLPAAEQTIALTVTNGTTQTATFAYDTTGGIIGTVYRDDGSGGGTALNNTRDTGELTIPDITVNLYNDVNGNGAYDAGTDTLAATTTTNSSGIFAFSGLNTGRYIVDVDQADADLPAYYSIGTTDPYPITVIPAESVVDFGFDPPGTVSGTVFRDLDDDNVLDPGETGIGLITVTITHTGPDGVIGTGDDV
ncbi:MAG: hypothetical protein IT326_06755, partial [Anaerolineae bacterium]|nr:hypothetical protein [Anaerolineae bacterium]